MSKILQIKVDYYEKKEFYNCTRFYLVKLKRTFLKKNYTETLSQFFSILSYVNY
jgi:hypothetical protein